jgi:hypothetical protein
MQLGWVTGMTGCPSAETIRRAREVIAAQRVITIGTDRYGDPIKAVVIEGDERRAARTPSPSTPASSTPSPPTSPASYLPPWRSTYPTRTRWST